MSSSMTQHVIHGPRSYIDFDKNRWNRRQLLVSDLTATVLTNLLAVFLAIAAKSLYNIARRILRIRIQNRQDKSQHSKTTSTNTAGNNGGLTPPTARTIQVPAIGMTADTVTGTAEIGNVAPNADAVATPVDHASAAQESHQHHMERLEMIDASHDTETLGITAFHRFLSQLPRIAPIRSLDDSRPTYRRMLTGKFWSNIFQITNEGTEDLLWNFLIALGAFILYFGSLLLSVMSAYPVAGNSVAISQHPRCGIMSPDASKANDSYYHALGQKYYSDIARESRQYAKSCYGLERVASDTPSPDSCSYFYQPNIEYIIIDNDTCPFRTAVTHLCLGGENSAFTVATGSANSNLVVDARVIGVNSPLQYKFHRSVTCSPLKTEGLVHPFPGNGTVGFWYLYGSRTGENNCTREDLPYCTFELMVDPNVNRRPYSVFTTSTIPVMTDSQKPLLGLDWQPIFTVDENVGETATLMLVDNYGISYPNRSHDPIFPANTTYDDGLYYNTQFHASVLGCISRTLVCLGGKTLGPCYSLRGLGNLDEIDDEHNSVRAMLYFSLLPDLAQQLIDIQGDALYAQSLLTGSHSSAISNDHWKDEVRQMFEALLARTQITARNIARGAPGEDLPGQQNLMKPQWQGLCTRYKFRAVGWKNISVSNFMVEFLAGLIVCILGITRENKELWIEEPMRRIAKSYLGGICISLATNLIGVLGICLAKAWEGLSWTFVLCWSGIHEAGKGIAAIARWAYDSCKASS